MEARVQCQVADGAILRSLLLEPRDEIISIVLISHRAETNFMNGCDNSNKSRSGVCTQLHLQVALCEEKDRNAYCMVDMQQDTQANDHLRAVIVLATYTVHS